MTYSPPTQSEIRALLAHWRLTGAAAGALLDVDGRTVRRWTGGDRTVSFAVLYTLASRAGGYDIDRETWRETLADCLRTTR